MKAYDLPEKCLRGDERCEPLSQIESGCQTSFMCFGYHGGQLSPVRGDIFMFCFKNDVLDREETWDLRDAIDTTAIITSGVSAHINRVKGRETKQDENVKR